MQLSSRTVDVLKNFATINSNIVIEPGNTLRTVSVAKNIVAKVTIDETFPNKVGIYDLGEFLSVVNLVDAPNLTYSETAINIADGSGLSSVKYHVSDPEMLTAPTKDIIMPECEVKLILNNDTLSRIKRAASALGHSEISIRPSNGAVEIAVVDSKDPTSNSFSVTVEGKYEEGTDFNFILNVANLKLIGEDYEVGISKKFISNFKSLQSELEYFIALEKTSTYGA